MFNNIVLDVFIGLIFIYLLYSLLATIIQELVARAFNLRARMLQKSLRRMLEDDGGNTAEPIWKNLTILAIFYDIGVSIVRFFNPKWDNEQFIKKFYKHPSIKYLGEDNTSSKPAYLHPQSFSQTMVQLLRGETYNGRTENESELIRNNLEDNTLQINTETLRQLKNLFYDARQDSVAFKVKLEDWFNEMQERTNGWYKKQTQVILIITGFCIACIFNVDTIAIYKILAKDKDARKALVQMAIENKDKYGQTVLLVDSQSFKNIRQAKDTILLQQLPDSTLKKTYEMLANDAEKANKILGLGKPWKDSCDTCKQYFPEDSRNRRQNIKSNLLKQIAGQNMVIEKLKGSIDSLNLQTKRSDKKTSQTDSEKIADSLKNKMDSVNIVSSGMNDQLHLLARCEYIKEQMKKHYFKYSPNQDGGATTFFGWLITALAISLGAPFWFDLLNKFVQLRGTGAKPPASSAGTTANNSNPSSTTGNTIRG
jgi:hypothetical protein